MGMIVQSRAGPAPTVSADCAASHETFQSAATWKQLAHRCAWFILYPVAYLAVCLARTNPEFTEHVYASRIFPSLRDAITIVFGSIPFSFAELLAYILVITVCMAVVICFVQYRKRCFSLRRFLSYVQAAAIVVAIGCNAFYWLWGFNYYRADLYAVLDVQKRDRLPTPALRELCLALADEANTLRAQVPEDDRGVFVYAAGNTGILQEIPAAYERLAYTEELFSGAVCTPKPVASSKLMSAASIAGIFIPFTEEPNVNVDCPPLLVAASAAHESAHYLGIAREDEANAIAFLACASSDNPQIRYSGYMLALIHAGNALANVDAEGYALLWARYDPAVVRDLTDNNAYVERNQGPVSETATRMNDNYLRGNNQPSGVHSYGEMVDFLGAYLQERGAHNLGIDWSA